MSEQTPPLDVFFGWLVVSGSSTNGAEPVYLKADADRAISTLTARCEALEQEKADRDAEQSAERVRLTNLLINERNRCEALTAERDYWKSQVDEAKARFDRDLQNYSSGYTQALDDALKGKPQ